MRFSVTYEIWTHDDIEAGDTDDRGFVVQDVGLREAVRAVDGYAPEPSASWPAGCRWFTNSTTDIRIGSEEQRSIHLPANITPASVRRIAKLLGARF